MGLNLLDLVWDFLKQSFIFFFAAVLLFLVVSRASPDSFFTQYYAKDTGTIVETTHAARGDILLAYDKIFPALPYDYKIETNNLQLRKANMTADATWKVRKRYGANDQVKVAPITLLNPATLAFQKKGNTIRVDESPVLAADCPIATPLRRIDTKLVINGNSPFVAELKTLEENFKPAPTTTTVNTFTIALNKAADGLVVTTADDAVSKVIGCRVAASLSDLRPTLMAGGTDTLTIAHGDMSGLSAGRIGTAIVIGLDGVLQ